MNAALWIVQGLLAAVFLFAGGTKLVLPLDQLTGPVALPGLLLRFIGVCEVLGALGLILPGVLRIRPGLTPLAATGLVIIMIGATVITLVAVEIAGRGERVDQDERRLRAVGHGHRRGAVQGDDGGGLQPLEEVVQPDDLRPVRVFRPRGLTVQRCDGRLEPEGTGAAAQGLVDERQRFRDLIVIPATTVLLLEIGKSVV